MVIVRVAGACRANFWGLWCQDAGVVVDRRIDFVVEVMVDGGWGCGIVVAVEGWHWYDDAFDRAEALTSIPASEGCRRCIVAPQALLALC
jgi:hypothetical protein